MCRESRRHLILRWLHHVTVCLLTLHPRASQSAEPSSLGCAYYPDLRTVSCSNTTLENIVHSVRILNVAANATVDAQTVEIVDSVMTQLPFLLPLFNTSLEAVKLVNSRLEFVYPDAFARLGETLKYLNLSNNRLHSVPYAIAALKNLEVLDLSDNQIVFLRPSPVFDGLRKLQVLILDRNYLGLSSDYVSHVKRLNVSANYSDHLSTKIGREDFDLGIAALSLANLSIRGNKFLTVPEQLYKLSFPSLRLLDLSDNLIQTLPKMSTRLLPVLQVLSLRNNRIRSVAFFSLPTKLIHLDLSGNPFHCDCESLWLHEWHYRTNASEILLPHCTTPSHTGGKHLAEVDREVLCPNQKNLVRYITKDTWKYRILAMSSTHRSISVSWIVDRSGPESWGLVYRKATDSPYQMILSTNRKELKHPSDNSKGEVAFVDDISGLTPDTLYIVCVAITQNNTILMEPSRCHEVHTKVGPIRGVKGSKFTTIFQGFSPSQRSIIVKWQSSATKTLSDTKQYIWNLKYRRFATPETTQIMIKVPSNAKNNQSHEYKIKGLEPFSGYAICFQSEGILLEGNVARAIPAHPIAIAETQESNIICKEVVTLTEEVFPVTEVAVATTVSTTTTVFVAFVMFFCCPRSFFRCHAKKLKNKLLKKSAKSSPTDDLVATSKNIEYQKPEEPAVEKISNLPSGRYLGPRLGSERKITPVAIPEVPSITNSPPPEVPPPPPPMPTLPKSQAPQNNKMSTRQLPPIPRAAATTPTLGPPAPAQPPSLAHSTTPLPSLPSESLPSDPIADYSSSESSISSVVAVEGESPETNEDEGYLTPKRPRKVRRITSSSRGHSKNGSTASRGEGYIHPDDIQYLGGRKVQVFLRGSRTLPRKVFLQNSIKEVSAFHPRYSLPHAWRRKGRESEEPPAEQISNAPLWFKSPSSDEFPSLKSDKRKKEAKRTGKKDNQTNPYCIEHV